MNTDCCKYCKSYSKAKEAKKGYCLRLKKATDKNSLCGYYKPDVRVEYQQEYKPASSWW